MKEPSSGQRYTENHGVPSDLTGETPYGFGACSAPQETDAQFRFAWTRRMFDRWPWLWHFVGG